MGEEQDSNETFAVSDETMDIIKEYVALRASILGLSFDSYLQIKMRKALKKSASLSQEGRPKDPDAVLRDDIMFMIRERARKQVERADKTESKEALWESQYKTKPADSPDLLRANRDGTQRERRQQKRDKKLKEIRLKTAPKSNPGSGGDGQGDSDAVLDAGSSI